MNHPLKLAVLRCGRPQYEIARAAGLDETRLSRIVQARVFPAPDERMRLAEVLGVTVADLFPSNDGGISDDNAGVESSSPDR